MTEILTTENLSIGYRSKREKTKTVIESVNLDLKKGELVALLGPNGSGKSTLLRTLANLQTPLKGEIILDGRPLSGYHTVELARQIAIVLTERTFPAFMTVSQVVSLGRIPHINRWGKLEAKDHAIVEQVLEKVGASKLRNRNIEELSDGEKQKVMIARALAQEPKVLILDEPTAFLDLVGKIEIFRLLKQLASDSEVAVLLSTHDFEMAIRIVDLVWLIQADGSLYKGAQEELMLSGHFSDTFQKEGIALDQQTGTFAFEEAFHTEIALEAEGLWEDWVAKALTRIGFLVKTSNTELPLRLIVKNQGMGSEWLLRTAKEERCFSSLYDLLGHLKRHFPASDA